MPLCLGCSSTVPRISPTNLNPQATGFPNPTNQTMIDMVDHWLYSWSRHRSLQWTARSKNNRRNSPLTVISKSVLNFHGTSLLTILLYHRNTCATAGRIETGARLWDQSPLPTTEAFKNPDILYASPLGINTVITSKYCEHKPCCFNSEPIEAKVHPKPLRMNVLVLHQYRFKLPLLLLLGLHIS